MNTLVPLRMKDKERLMRIYGTLSRGVDFINSPDIKISRNTSMSTAIDGYQEIEKSYGSELCLIKSALVELGKFIEASNTPKVEVI